jgi:hypothetical protein
VGSGQHLASNALDLPENRRQQRPRYDLLGGTVPAIQVKRVVVLILGWTLIGIGVVGLFVPILQGILFIILGLFVLSRESRWARSWLEKLSERYPNIHSKARRLKERMMTRIGLRS